MGSLLAPSPTECIFFFSLLERKKSKKSKKQWIQIWPEQTGTSEHVAWRRNEEKKKKVQKTRERLQMVVIEGEKRGWMWTEHKHSWSPVCCFTHGYTRWWVERSRIGGALTLPQAISQVGAFRKRLRWQEAAAGNFKVITSVFCLVY